MLAQFGIAVIALGIVGFTAIAIMRGIRRMPRALVPFFVLMLAMTAAVIVLAVKP